MRQFIIISTLFFAFSSFKTKSDFGMHGKFKLFSKNWTMLEKDTIGYLVYDPCDGATPTINIKGNDVLIVQWQLEIMKYKIRRLTQINANDFLFSCDNTFQNDISNFGEPDITFQVRLVDKIKKIYLWTWVTEIGEGIKVKDTTRWVMTPTRYSAGFRKVNNPCPTEKKKEKVFLPIEFK